MDAEAAAATNEAPSISTVPSALFDTPPTLGKSEDGRRLCLMANGETHFADTIGEVRELIHNLLSHGHITDDTHERLCIQAAGFAKIDQGPGAIWFEMTPSTALWCPRLTKPKPVDCRRGRPQ